MEKCIPVDIVSVDHGSRKVRVHDSLGFVGPGHFTCILGYYPLSKG